MTTYTLNQALEAREALANARRATSRPIRAHYINLAAFWRLAKVHGTHAWPERNPLALQAATGTFTHVADHSAQLPQDVVR